MASNLLSNSSHLRNTAARKKSVGMATASSSAVEGIRRPFAKGKKKVSAPTRRRTRSG